MTRTRIRSRFAGRRLSLTRLLVSVAAFAIVSASAVAAVVLPQLPPQIPGTPMSQRWFASYYDVTIETGEELARSALGTAPGGVALAFVVAADDGECTPTWGKTYSLDAASTLFQLDRRVERMRREGRPLSVSFGGAINTELAGACATVTDLTDAYRTVMDRYGIDVMDLDIEGDDLEDAEAAVRRAQAVARLQQERQDAGGSLDVWLTLPVAPNGLTGQGLAQIVELLDAGVHLSGVNAMTMNYGADGAADSMSALSIDALRAVADQLSRTWDARDLALPVGGVWALMGATPMIGRNDVPGEVFTLDDARALQEFASAQGMARVSMWSLNRDRTCGSNYPHLDVVSPSCSGIEQGGESFATILSSGYDGAPSGVSAPADEAEVIADDPSTSPYPVWSSEAFYSAGVSVVWKGSVYMAKWWNEGGAQPDDPTLDANGSAWTYIGPVLSGDEPFTLPQLPAGTYPDWSPTTLYNQGDRVMLDGAGYEARWWSQGQSPARAVLDHDYSPWKLLTDGP